MKEMYRVPLVFPYASSREIEFNRLLSSLEGHFFPLSASSLVVEDTTDIAIDVSSHLIASLFSSFASLGTSSSGSTLSSTFKQLEDLTLRGMGVCLEQPWALKEREQLALLLLDDAISTLEHASCCATVDRSDWMSGNRTGITLEASGGGSSAGPKKPYIFWAYFFLRKVLKTSYELHGDIASVMTSRLPSVLLTCCRSYNTSLRYCSHDLMTLFTISNPKDQKAIIGLNILVHEKRLLLEFSERIRSEVTSNGRKVVSRYTWRLLLLLQQWKRLTKPEGDVNFTRRELFSEWRYLLNAALCLSSPTEDANQITAVKISSSSLSVSWLLNDSSKESLLSNGSFPLPLTGNTLTIRSVSNFNSCAFSESVANIDFYGLYRFDNLLPGTLYEISIHKDAKGSAALALSTLTTSSISIPPAASITDGLPSSDETVLTTARLELLALDDTAASTPSQFPLYVTTDPLESMFLDSAGLPANLALSNGGLTVRNTASKKWSTVRSTSRFISGVNCWDVRIDRCISKNIFIGVVTESANMDNYVGSDRKGWAFLANRAVWHNKAAKLKPYGELFRTGDIISVILDLDVGTLSFSLNGKSLGVAADGLSVAVHGEFYPAFSLYNDDDQLSILPPRSGIDGNASAPMYSWSSTASERILDRVDALSAVVGIAWKVYYPEEMEQATEEDLQELFQRHVFRLSGLGAVRSVLTSGDIVTVLVSATACSKMTARIAIGTDKLAPGHCMQWEGAGRVCQLLGYASNKLWMQWLSTGEAFGCTEEMLRQAIGRGVFDTITGSPSTAQQAAPAKALPSREAFEASLLTKDYLWTLERDEAVVGWIETVSQSYGFHPLLLPRGILMQHTQALDAPGVEEDILEARVTLLLMINDLFQVLLPLLASGAFDSEPEENVRDIGSLLSRSKGLLFTQIKMDFASKYSSTPVSTANANVDVKADADLSKTLHVVDFTVEDEEVVLAYIVSLTEPGARHLLFEDSRWRLLAGLQASVSIQFMTHLECRVDSDQAVSSSIENALRAMAGPASGWFHHRGISSTDVQCVSVLVRMSNISSTNFSGDELDYIHFKAFVNTAAQQTQYLLESIINYSTEELSVAEISLVITYMQAAGVVCGLAMNNLIPFRLDLPDGFTSIIVGVAMADLELCGPNPQFLTLFAHAFRRGIISVFPEVHM